MVNKSDFRLFEIEPYDDGYKILGFNEDLDESDGINEDDFLYLYFPEGTVAIAEDAFLSDCVRSVSFPRSLKEIGESAFSNCEELHDAIFHSECYLTKLSASAFEGTDLSRIELPKSLRVIGERAFAECKNLESVNSLELYNLEKIEDGAFEGCISLKWFELPEDNVLRSIGDDAFSECVSLEGVNFHNMRLLKSIGDSAFMWCSSFKTALSFNYGLTTLGANAFASCSSLQYVGIPQTLKNVDMEVFDGCVSLKQINADFAKAPSSWDEFFLDGCPVEPTFMTPGNYTPISKLILQPYPYEKGKYTVIGPMAWGIEELILNPDIIDIAKNAFKDQLRLRRFKANCSRVIIGDRAFYNCPSLLDIDFNDAYIGEHTFTWCAIKTAILTDTNSSRMYYESAVENIKINSPDVKHFQSYSFFGTRIKELTVPPNFDSISSYAFSNCAQLKRVDLGNIHTLHEGAFSYCGALEEIVFPKNKLTVWDGAFKECNSLKRVEIPENVGFSREMFADCHFLREVVIHGKKPYVNQDSFLRCAIQRLVLKDLSYSEGKELAEKILLSAGTDRATDIEVVFKDRKAKARKMYKIVWI